MSEHYFVHEKKAFQVDDVDEFEDEDELVEGDERDDMAEERLVGETDDFF